MRHFACEGAKIVRHMNTLALLSFAIVQRRGTRRCRTDSIGIVERRPQFSRRRFWRDCPLLTLCWSKVTSRAPQTQLRFEFCEYLGISVGLEPTNKVRGYALLQLHCHTRLSNSRKSASDSTRANERGPARPGEAMLPA